MFELYDTHTHIYLCISNTFFEYLRKRVLESQCFVHKWQVLEISSNKVKLCMHTYVPIIAGSSVVEWVGVRAAFVLLLFFVFGR